MVAVATSPVFTAPIIDLVQSHLLQAARRTQKTVYFIHLLALVRLISAAVIEIPRLAAWRR